LDQGYQAASLCALSAASAVAAMSGPRAVLLDSRIEHSGRGASLKIEGDDDRGIIGELIE
jgi:hypothetical protein